MNEGYENHWPACWMKGCGHSRVYTSSDAFRADYDGHPEWVNDAGIAVCTCHPEQEGVKRFPCDQGRDWIEKGRAGLRTLMERTLSGPDTEGALAAVSQGLSQGEVYRMARDAAWADLDQLRAWQGGALERQRDLEDRLDKANEALGLAKDEADRASTGQGVALEGQRGLEARLNEATAALRAAQDQIVQLAAERDKDQVVLRSLADDFDYVGKRLLQEALDRDWCSEFNEFVDDVNERLVTGRTLPEIVQWDVYVHWTDEFDVLLDGTQRREIADVLCAEDLADGVETITCQSRQSEFVDAFTAATADEAIAMAEKSRRWDDDRTFTAERAS